MKGLQGQECILGKRKNPFTSEERRDDEMMAKRFTENGGRKKKNPIQDYLTH